MILLLLFVSDNGILRTRRLLHFSPHRPNSLPGLNAHGLGGPPAFTAHRDFWWLTHTRCLAFAKRHRRGWNFGYSVSTDGVSVSIGFERDSTPWAPLHPNQLPQSGQSQPVRGVLGQFLPNLQHAQRIVGMDPGRINIFTAAVHDQQAAQTLQRAAADKYPTLHYTAARFAEHSGARARTARVTKWLGVDSAVNRVIRLMPTARTSSSQDFCQHVTYRLQHNSLVANHFTSRRYKTLRWQTYISRQRALSIMCNEVTANNRDTIVALGNASFAHNSRGRPSSLTKGFKRQLAGQCRLYEVDERYTSALCCACHEPMTGMDLGTGIYLPTSFTIDCT